MKAAAAKHELVTVSVTLTDNDGNELTEDKSVDSGATPVPALKQELGIDLEDSLWVIRSNGQRHQLVDHATHNVKAGDHFEALVRGGVS
jgi:hypothetical protein